MPYKPGPGGIAVWTPPTSGELYVPPWQGSMKGGNGEEISGFLVTSFTIPLSGMTIFTGDLGHNRWSDFGHSTLRGTDSFYQEQHRLIAEAGKFYGCRYVLEPFRWNLYRYVALFWAVHYPDAVRAAGSWLDGKQRKSWLRNCATGERICPCKGHTIYLETVSEVSGVPGGVKCFPDLVQWLKATRQLVSYVDVNRRGWWFVCL